MTIEELCAHLRELIRINDERMRVERELLLRCPEAAAFGHSQEYIFVLRGAISAFNYILSKLEEPTKGTCTCDPWKTASGSPHARDQQS